MSVLENLMFRIDIAGKNLYELHSSRIKTRNTHGTGCTLASCIAAALAKGSSMLKAVKVITFTLLNKSHAAGRVDEKKKTWLSLLSTYSEVVTLKNNRR